MDSNLVVMASENGMMKHDFVALPCAWLEGEDVPCAMLGRNPESDHDPAAAAGVSAMAGASRASGGMAALLADSRQSTEFPSPKDGKFTSIMSAGQLRSTMLLRDVWKAAYDHDVNAMHLSLGLCGSFLETNFDPLEWIMGRGDATGDTPPISEVNGGVGSAGFVLAELAPLASGAERLRVHSISISVPLSGLKAL